MRKIPESLVCRFAAVVDYADEIIFAGRYDECVGYLERNIKRVKSGELDLRFAEKLDGGFIELGIFASFVLKG